MAYNLIRFERGKIEAYNALRDANRLDENTLYFIYSDDNTTGSLYMGSRYISGGDVTIESGSLEKLTDVILTSVQANDFLVYNQVNQKWENKSVSDVAGIILEGKLDTLNTKVASLETQVETITIALGNKVEKTDLQTELDKKVDKIEGYTLLNPDDKAKLDLLVIDGDGDLAISGTVNAANVEGLGLWIQENAVISESNLSDEVKIKLNYITSVEDTQLDVTEGKLSIKVIEGSIVNLSSNEDYAATKQSLLDSIADLDTITLAVEQVKGDTDTLKIAVSDLQTGFTTMNNDIAELKEVLTWKEMSVN